jgi:iron(III) transport system substrate-binding protein
MARNSRWLQLSRRAALSCILVSVVTACVTQTPEGSKSGSTGSPTSAPSNAAGSITVYTALEDDQLAKYLPLFEKAHPEIKVNKVRDSTGVVIAKLLAEKDNPQADVVWGLAVSSLLVADQQGMLEPYAPKGLDAVGAKFKDERTPPHWVGIDAWMSAFCVNTTEMKKKNLAIPQSWADLTKPEYKGLIVMSNPASSGTGFLSVSAMLQMKGDPEGWNYLDALDKNVAQYVHSGSKPCKIAGTGEYPIGISFDYRAVKQKNATCKFFVDKSGKGANALIG